MLLFPDYDIDKLDDLQVDGLSAILGPLKKQRHFRDKIQL